MRKILVILTMLVLLISCGKKGSKNDPFKDLGNNKGGNSSKQVNEVEKYNLYVGVHNELLSFEKSAGDYFEDAGAEAQFKKPSGSVSINLHQIPTLIQKIKKATEAKPKWNELDKSAEGLLPIFEELAPLAQDMKAYFDGKDYTSDNYKKAQEYHTKFLEIIKKYDQAVAPFRTAMDKKVAEQKESEAKMYQKEGRMIAYNRMMIMNTAEEVLAEIRNQKLNGANITTGDAAKFKALQEKLIKVASEYQNAIRDEKELKKEGVKDNSGIKVHWLTSFMDETNDFKAALVSLIQRIETKKAVDQNTLNNSFFLESENGTPENMIKQFNELVGEYNRSIR